MVVTFKEENTASFKHLFLKDYRDGSSMAIHTQSELYSHIYYAVDQVLVSQYATLIRDRQMSDFSTLSFCSM
jgi:hypothetical protein